MAKFLGWYLANKKAAVIGLKEFGNEPPPITLSLVGLGAGDEPELLPLLRRDGRQQQGGQHRLHDLDVLAAEVRHLHHRLDGRRHQRLVPRPQAYCAGLWRRSSRPSWPQGEVPPLFKPNAYAAL